MIGQEQLKGKTMSTNGRIIQTRFLIAVLLLGCGLTGRAHDFAGGTGEPNDPYQIATAEDLLAVGSSKDLLTKHYVLVNDLDLDPNLPGGRVFDDALIAQDQYEDVSGHSGEPFTGVLDGHGRAIRNLCISGRDGYDAGLFGKLSGLVKDLRLQDVRISGSPCGAMAGLNEGLGVILRCSVTGHIWGSENTGGIVGTNWDGALIDCSAEVRVTGVQNVGGMVGGGPGATLIRCELRGDVGGDSSVGGLVGEMPRGQVIDSRVRGTATGRDNVGGLVGTLANAASIIRSTAECDVTAEFTAGGLVGDASLSASRSPLISDCHSRGVVAGTIVGGLIGAASWVRIVNSYAACEMVPMVGATPVVLGGLLGEADVRRPPLAPGCFWDAELSGVSAGIGSGRVLGTSLTTEQMQQQATFEQAGWDFDSVWVMAEDGYPVLQWEVAADAGQGANDER